MKEIKRDHIIKYKSKVLFKSTYFDYYDERINTILSSLRFKSGQGYHLESFIRYFFNKFTKGLIYQLPPKELLRYLRMTGDLGAYLFHQRITPKGENFRMAFGGYNVEGEGSENVSDWHTDAAALKRCIDYAIISENWEGLKFLCSITQEQTSDGKKGNNFFYHYVHFLQAIFSNDSEKIQATFTKAYEYTDLEKHPVSHPFFEEQIHFIYVPLLETYLGIITNNEELYNEKLYDGLNLYKEFISHPDEGNSTQRWEDNFWYYAIGYITATKIAKMNGLETKVVSDYIPKWLTEGGFEDYPMVLLDEDM